MSASNLGLYLSNIFSSVCTVKCTCCFSTEILRNDLLYETHFLPLLFPEVKYNFTQQLEKMEEHASPHFREACDYGIQSEKAKPLRKIASDFVRLGKPPSQKNVSAFSVKSRNSLLLFLLAEKIHLISSQRKMKQPGLK